MSDKPTCGPLYFDGLNQFGGANRDTQLAFAAGFMSGEAEKVYLGACDGAMFRPSPEFHDWMRGVVGDIAARYGLVVRELPTARGLELWLLRDQSLAASIFLQVTKCPENSRAWHLLRAQLCGVIAGEIDFEFHLRRGAGEPCDRVGAPVP